MKRIFFDIETLANPENCALMADPVIEAPANYKDPAKIAEYIAEKTLAAKAAAMDKAALDPDYGKILSIGYMVNGPVEVVMVGDVKEKRLVSHNSETGEDIWNVEYTTETDLLNMFWRIFKECAGYCVGYNILGFDLPYLLRRSMALGVRVPLIPNLAKFRTDPVTDLMQILYNWEFGKWKGLKQVAKLYKIPNDCPDVDGSQVKNLPPEELRAYAASDVKLVIELYKRMNGVYFNHA